MVREAWIWNTSAFPGKHRKCSFRDFSKFRREIKLIVPCDRINLFLSAIAAFDPTHENFLSADWGFVKPATPKIVKTRANTQHLILQFLPWQSGCTTISRLKKVLSAFRFCSNCPAILVGVVLIPTKKSDRLRVQGETRRGCRVRSGQNTKLCWRSFSGHRSLEGIYFVIPTATTTTPNNLL